MNPGKFILTHIEVNEVKSMALHGPITYDGTKRVCYYALSEKIVV